MSDRTGVRVGRVLLVLLFLVLAIGLWREVGGREADCRARGGEPVVDPLLRVRCPAALAGEGS